MSDLQTEEPPPSHSSAHDKVLLAMKSQITMMGFEYTIHMGIYGLKVCEKVTTVEALWEACVRHRPSMLIMNLGMNRDADPNLIRKLLEFYPDLRIIVLAGAQGGISLQEAIKSGALAYLGEGDSIEAVLQAIVDVHKGRLHVGSLVASQVFQAIASGNAEIVLKIQTMLTPRELEVFHKRGMHNGIKDIAASLLLSTKTVEAHLLQIRQKLLLKHTDDMRTIALEFLSEEEMLIRIKSLPMNPEESVA